MSESYQRMYESTYADSLTVCSLYVSKGDFALYVLLSLQRNP